MTKTLTDAEVLELAKKHGCRDSGCCFFEHPLGGFAVELSNDAFTDAVNEAFAKGFAAAEAELNTGTT